MKYEFGERIRKVRRRKGYTLKDVAKRANVSESLVSQIERNRISPAIDTLLTLADVLDMDVDYLFRDLKKERTVNLVRHDQRRIVNEGGVTYECLSSTPDERDAHGIEAYELTIMPGAHSGSNEYGHTGKELGVIAEGSGVFRMGNNSYELRPGDSISFASDAPHSLENVGEGVLKAFWVITPPREMGEN